MLYTQEGLEALVKRTRLAPELPEAVEAAKGGRLWLVDSMGYDDPELIIADTAMLALETDTNRPEMNREMGQTPEEAAVTCAQLAEDRATREGWIAEPIKLRRWTGTWYENGREMVWYPANDSLVEVLRNSPGAPAFDGREVAPDDESGGTYWCDTGEHIPICDCDSCKDPARKGRRAWFCAQCAEEDVPEEDCGPERCERHNPSTV